MAKKTVVKNTPQQSQPVPEKNDCLVDALSLDKCVKMIGCQYHLVPQYKIDSAKLEELKDLQDTNVSLIIQKNACNETIRELKEKAKVLHNRIDVLGKKAPPDLRVLEQKNSQLREDSLSLYKKMDSLEKQAIPELNGKINSLRTDSSNLSLKVDSLKNASIFYPFQNPWLSVPTGCVLIALIISITMISLKRGLTFTKGNTSICLGEKKKTRAKKVD